jgi:hypothetical protein
MAALLVDICQQTAHLAATLVEVLARYCFNPTAMMRDLLAECTNSKEPTLFVDNPNLRGTSPNTMHYDLCGNRGLKSMIDHEECWQNARDCERWAQLASNHSDREHFLAMATCWTRLLLGQNTRTAKPEDANAVVALFAHRLRRDLARNFGGSLDTPTIASL